jgi:hypothetical protein
MWQHRLVCGFVGLSTAACGAGWHQIPRPAAGEFPLRQQVQVWSADRMLRWHAVVVRHDSISGIPFVQRPDCGSCRRALPLGQVDSVRLGHPVAGFWKTLGLAVGIPLAVLGVLCGFDVRCLYVPES